MTWRAVTRQVPPSGSMFAPASIRETSAVAGTQWWIVSSHWGPHHKKVKAVTIGLHWSLKNNGENSESKRDIHVISPTPLSLRNFPSCVWSPGPEEPNGKSSFHLWGGKHRSGRWKTLHGIKVGQGVPLRFLVNKRLTMVNWLSMVYGCKHGRYIYSWWGF